MLLLKIKRTAFVLALSLVLQPVAGGTRAYGQVAVGPERQAWGPDEGQTCLEWFDSENYKNGLKGQRRAILAVGSLGTLSALGTFGLSGLGAALFFTLVLPPSLMGNSIATLEGFLDRESINAPSDIEELFRVADEGELTPKGERLLDQINRQAERRVKFSNFFRRQGNKRAAPLLLGTTADKEDKKRDPHFAQAVKRKSLVELIQAANQAGECGFVRLGQIRRAMRGHSQIIQDGKDKSIPR